MIINCLIINIIINYYYQNNLRCGTEAVICNWDNVMVILSKSGKSITYSYDYPIHLIPEMDCVRVISGLTHELIQKVPAVVQKIFRINSVEPGSYLLEASKQFQVMFMLFSKIFCISLTKILFFTETQSHGRRIYLLGKKSAAYCSTAVYRCCSVRIRSRDSKNVNPGCSIWERFHT